MLPIHVVYLGLGLIVVGGWVAATSLLHLKPEYRKTAFSVRGGLLDMISSERYTETGRRWRIAGYTMALIGLILFVFGDTLFSLVF